MPEGPVKESVVPLSMMLPEYYKLRGWDGEGVSTGSKLKDLNIS